MSFDGVGPEMVHVAVNTDPLQMLLQEESTKTHYGLKVRNIPHIKISEMNELKVWYEFGEKIGEGGFGIVMAVKEKSNNKEWAMKLISKSTAGDNIRMVEQEIQILKLIHHPHIIYLDKIFESPKKMYLVFERCHVDFAKIYNERKPFAEKIARKIISELVDAVAYLHKYEIVHRDLKMENILLGENPLDPTDEYYIKLTDFGLSSIVKSGKGIESMLHEFCGTIYYMAPEMITFRSYSQMCDMWSVGVILYMLVIGKYPFYGKNDKEIQIKICTQSPKFDTKLSQELEDLILLLLVKDPVKRIRATEVLQHPWISSKKMSKAMYSYNIMDKMKEWKSEMTVETGAVSDWVMTPDEAIEANRSQTKQAMNLPKTNINFDRASRRMSNPKKISPKEQLLKPSPKPTMKGQSSKKRVN
ncbi:serine/threonine-protein kinase 33-like isoform X2 [Tribolium madens]|uniref:serine/threonine-protein kinase 33-like isoform X2 n=1 Tax=Tribolium madens TaxID=41895 RepID=UPI001CF74963|nr:serine/threonine-protein kinase 33-like isoform X2 [Tribolium madens]